MTPRELVMSDKRRCYYLDETHPDPDNRDRFMVALVFENEPGFCPMAGQGDHAIPWYWDKETCKVMNLEKFSLSEEEALSIVLSSMFPRRVA